MGERRQSGGGGQLGERRVVGSGQLAIVRLTTVGCTHKTLTNYSLSFRGCNFKNFEAYNIP